MAQVLRQRPEQWRAQFAVGPARRGRPRHVAGLNIYGDVVGGFSDDDEQLSQAFAAQASTVVSNAQAYGRVRLSRNLATAMESRAVIEQAKGVLMSTHRIDADVAFEVLREISQTSNRKLRDVAADVVEKAAEGDDDA